MKSILFRLSKSWNIVFLSVCPLLFVILMSLLFLNDCEKRDLWWAYPIDEYTNSSDIDMQIEQITILEQECSAEDAVIMKETKEILEFLKKNDLKYDDVQEGSILTPSVREQRSYSFYMMEVLFFFQLFLSIYVVFLVNNIGKSNGAFSIAYLMHGKKRCFWEEGLSYLFIMLYCLIPQLIYIVLTRKALPDSHNTLLFYNNGEIQLTSTQTEFTFLTISLCVTMLCVYLLHFILSEILDNVILFVFLSGVVNLLTILLVNSSGAGGTLILGVWLNSIYEYGLTVRTYVISHALLLVFLGALVFGAYKLSMQKKIRTEYN